MHFLAIDLGTESARASVFDLDGRCVSTQAIGYQTDFPQPGWAEQDSRDWRSAMIAASRLAIDDSGIRRVAGICVATTASSVVFLDENNHPLRPALLWMDTRAHREALETAAVKHPNIKFSGGVDSPEWLVPKAMWVKRNQPEIFDRCHRVGEALDYLTSELTGEWVGSDLNATCKWNYDPRVGSVPRDLYQELGIPDLAEKLPQIIMPVGTPVGELLPSVASEMGLDNTPIVSTGGIDAHMALISLRGLGDHVVSVAAGTSNAFITEASHEFESSEVWGPYPNALTKGRWLAEGGQLSAGSVISWVGETLLGYSRRTISELIGRVGERGPDAHELIVLDDFMGNRTPYRDARMRGGILGLSLSSTPEDIYQATIEGVAFGTRHVLDSFRRAGLGVENLYFSGGISHNSAWLQTTVDALGVPVNLVRAENLTLIATATAAAVGAGSFSSWDEAQRVFHPRIDEIEPRPMSQQILSERFEEYLEFKNLNRPAVVALRGGESRRP